MPAGANDESYRQEFEEKIVPELEKYKPQAIIITAGFDAHQEDPLASIMLSDDIYGQMTRYLTDIAGKYSEGRVLSFFEGGYNPSSNARSLYNHLKELQKD
jgi:acetoin utilization deacetylase AcuC-like enzyme